MSETDLKICNCGLPATYIVETAHLGPEVLRRTPENDGKTPLPPPTKVHYCHRCYERRRQEAP